MAKAASRWKRNFTLPSVSLSRICLVPETSGGYFINYWYIDYAFSFRDEKGKLDSRSKIFQTMIYSLKLNPRWIAKVVNVKEMLAQSYIKGIKAVGQMGQMIAQAGSQMREDQQRAWEQRQQVNDRIVQNFSDHIRGVERYNDPRAGKEVELPAGYGNAWANDLGEYIVSESPSYNPNIEFQSALGAVDSRQSRKARNRRQCSSEIPALQRSQYIFRNGFDFSSTDIL